MKRLITLLLLAASFAATAQNSAKYDHFKELRDQTDTLGMKQMLDAWGAEDEEYYAAWTNYCQVMAENTEEESWASMAVNWAKMGRDAFPDSNLLLHKQAESLFGANRFREALPVLLELEEKGLGEGYIWYELNMIYGMKDDLDNARHYLEKMIAEGDEEDRAYAEEVIAALDEDQHIRDSLALHIDHAAIKAFAGTPEFQQLVSRYEACDTTLTREDFARIYYGSAYVKDYNSVNSQCDDIRQLAEEEKIDEAIAALQEKLKEYPVSLFILLSLFNLTEDEAALTEYAWKGQVLLATISLSGNGTKDRPYQVTSVNDEYNFLNQVYEATELLEQSLVDGPMDKMTILNSVGLDQDVYFYLAPPYWERLDALTQEKVNQ